MTYAIFTHWHHHDHCRRVPLVTFIMYLWTGATLWVFVTSPEGITELANTTLRSSALVLNQVCQYSLLIVLICRPVPRATSGIQEIISGESRSVLVSPQRITLPTISNTPHAGQVSAEPWSWDQKKLTSGCLALLLISIVHQLPTSQPTNTTWETATQPPTTVFASVGPCWAFSPLCSPCWCPEPWHKSLVGLSPDSVTNHFGARP